MPGCHRNGASDVRMCELCLCVVRYRRLRAQAASMQWHCVQLCMAQSGRDSLELCACVRVCVSEHHRNGVQLGRSGARSQVYEHSVLEPKRAKRRRSEAKIHRCEYRCTINARWQLAWVAIIIQYVCEVFGLLAIYKHIYIQFYLTFFLLCAHEWEKVTVVHCRNNAGQ